MAQAEDPRTHITPDAFGVAPELLGYALASPTRRLAAIGIDMGLAAILARTGIEFLLAAAAALFAWRAIAGPADRLLAGRSRVVLRAATAVLALIVVTNIWNGAADRVDRLKRGIREAEARSEVMGGPGDSERGEDLQVALEDLGLSAGEKATFLLRFATLQMADSGAGGQEAAALGRWVREKTSPGERRDEFSAALAAAMKPAIRDAFLREVGDTVEQDSAGAPQAADTVGVPGLAAGDSADSAAVAAAGADSADSAQSVAVTPADSLRLLAAANQQLRERNQRLREELSAAREQQPGGVRGMLSGLSDDLGLGFGWFALYFTAFTVLGRGQTPGKRVLGIKVLRCDNRPISWWLAFERFGGYAASFSTGLLGFAQILWDRNRQGLHDKAADTVVVRLRNGQPIRIA